MIEIIPFDKKIYNDVIRILLYEFDVKEIENKIKNREPKNIEEIIEILENIEVNKPTQRNKNLGIEGAVKICTLIPKNITYNFYLNIYYDYDLSDEIGLSLGIKKDNINAVKLKETDNNIKYENNTFDIITILLTLHHSALYETIIKEIYRILKPSGIVIIKNTMFLKQILKIL